MKTLLLQADGTVTAESGRPIWSDLPVPKGGKVRALIATTDDETFPFDREGCTAALHHQHRLGARFGLAEIPALVDWLFDKSAAHHIVRGGAQRLDRDSQLADWMNAYVP